MSTYSDYFSINKNFQSSINLELDLDNEAKIEEYIPTSDICAVLKIYFGAFLMKSTDHATTLIGPYGKGKSFLLLVLSYLVYHQKDKAYSDLLNKIKGIDIDLYEMIEEANIKGLKLLPVIINSNFNDLQQSFMLGLSEALTRAGINEVIPTTVYTVCLNLMEKWRKDTFIREKFNVCAKQKKTTFDELAAGLKNYSVDSYQKFKWIYNCITAGLEFNPLVNNDVVKIYSSVNHELISSRQYSGMFIIFDEFSKFIEGADNSLMRELKVIQDFAELAERSNSSEQINLCCVTHKSLDLYYRGTSKIDSFKTVEGRFKEIRFTSSLEENYEIIAHAINKKRGAKKIRDAQIADLSDFYARVQHSQPFSDQTDDSFQILKKDCFPLNPMTAYALIKLSEQVAQNERTLFTFLSDTDENSLNMFLQKTDTGIMNVDKVYDYFSALLQKEEENAIRNIWYRAEGILSRISNQKQRAIIKALAVILMIGDNDHFASTVENISLAACVDEAETEAIIESLIDEHFLRKNVINNLTTFASSNNKAIEEKVNVILRTKKNSVSAVHALEDIDETKYILPRKYNEENKITRFYRIVYLTEEQFFSLSDFDVIKNEMFCDGLVVDLIRKSENIDSRVKEKLDDIQDYSIVVRYPSHPVNHFFEDELFRYAALKEILTRGGNDQVISAEIELLMQETVEDIRVLLDEYFGEKSHYYSYQWNGKDSFTELLSDQMSRLYTKKIVFNNELINKNRLSTQYQKPVNNVMQLLLDEKSGESWNFSETSPEGTVNSTIISKINEGDVPEVINCIKEKIINSEGSRCLISDIVKTFNKPPYGVRRGILQILIAKAISELSDNVILYLGNNEIDLNANNLWKSIYSGEKYYFGFAKGSKDQQEYLKKMLESLRINQTGNFRNDTKLLCEGYRRFFIGLPMIVRADGKNSYLGISQEINAYKKIFMQFNINPYEAVYDDVLRYFHSYNNAYEALSDFMNAWQQKLSAYKMSLIDIVRQIFSIENNVSLKMSMDAFVRGAVGNTRPVLKKENMRIMSSIEQLNYDDEQAIDNLSHACTGSYIEDWNDDRKDELKNTLLDFRNDLENSDKISTSESSLDDVLNKADSVEISQMGKLMETTVESTFEEYGDSVSTEEKIAILSKLLKSIIK
ncbi:hypothetical protein MOZ60_01955 [Stecheria sp. CLA-KB-P133]|uniref:Uncharacterized protein n=1 Tax=Grylomicrobium aquisgranensis TaxID=2926318 RepID=A0AB35U1R4_9FIRM|nr:hypothetical protein [Lactimicrobium massiliense]MDD6560149.1 hypothetical protein [Lactimicrobium massiliense]MDX8418854.1 hypothetical protein [Stecheria sp. CLA-KB-P133]MDY3931352.1 hypothetical protein [Erysipelotrichaceae bacterium]